MKIKKVPLQCRKKRHYNDTIFQLKQHVSWVNGPDSHFGMTQKLKYKIIVAQDIVGVKCEYKLDIDLSGRIYPDRVGSQIQICGCPRGVSPWDVCSMTVCSYSKFNSIFPE